MAKQWDSGDRVAVKFEDEEFYFGTITKTRIRKAFVAFDDGDKEWFSFKDLVPEADFINDEENDDEEEQKRRGFLTYNVKWDKERVNFSFEADGAVFYGWYRKVSITGGGIFHAIDINATCDDKSYAVTTIQYANDPRGDLPELNSDICMATNKWFFNQCSGNLDTIRTLREKADKPMITVNKVETIDQIITQLSAYRGIALSTGGFRCLIIEGDFPTKEPSIRITFKLGKQAAALGSDRVPKLFSARALDLAAEGEPGESVAASKERRRRGKKQGRGKAEVNALQTEMTEGRKANVEALQKRLEVANEEGDKKECRKIRGMLRKLGHKGGSRKS